jgi:cytochrome c-type biogenesis protein CcmH/NrfG
MSLTDKWMDEELDPELEQALRSFRASVHAWSEAELSRPRAATTWTAVHKRSWRLAAGVALAAVLTVGGVSGGMYERHRQQERAAIAARAAEQQRLAAAQQAREEEEDLLAKVDSDVSRSVPSAMEPLAQLMAEDETQ